MIKYEIINSKLSQPKSLDADIIIQEIEEIINTYGLNITQKTTLSTMKGSIHYHLKQGKEAGVLELTYWPSKNRLWTEIHDNRLADWNKDIIFPFTQALANCFCGELRYENE
ncbi:hypothetical protein FHS15_004924 [Paenibacillus castaneae]|uniref:hypothetical protein n=1 Tax=Paenibacillus castaneae TaxID=474957 RepID=UPI000C9998BE|nr:hypothetical protein [Paenibacillus castaneae]NIK79757.1 hypothetical protein [Paenibacillus castaneae]